MSCWSQKRFRSSKFKQYPYPPKLVRKYWNLTPRVKRIIRLPHKACSIDLAEIKIFHLLGKKNHKRKKKQ